MNFNIHFSYTSLKDFIVTKLCFTSIVLLMRIQYYKTKFWNNFTSAYSRCVIILSVITRILSIYTAWYLFACFKVQGKECALVINTKQAYFYCLFATQNKNDKKLETINTPKPVISLTLKNPIAYNFLCTTYIL